MPSQSFDQLMERSRQWDRNHAMLMRDHAEYRSRLDAAILSPKQEAGAANNRSGNTQ